MSNESLREGLAKVVEQLVEDYSSDRGRVSIHEAGQMSDKILTHLKSQGWGPKGEEWNAAIEAAAKRMEESNIYGVGANLAAMIRSLKHGGA